MLLAAEELLLFLLDEQNATLLPMTVRTEHLVLAGAVLMDLQLANRIDTDLDNLTVSNPTPLGDDVLDPTLADIVGAEKTHDALYWVERTARRGHEIRERTIARLVSRGILLAPGDEGFLSLTRWRTRGAIHRRTERCRRTSSCASCGCCSAKTSRPRPTSWLSAWSMPATSGGSS